MNIAALSVLRPGESIDEKVRTNFFLRTEVTKTTCFVGEPLMVTYKVYSRLNSSSQVLKRPSLTGFSILEMVDNYDGEPTVEQLDGKPYYVSVIRKVHLFPLQEGSFTLDPAEIESVIHFVRIHEVGPRERLEHTITLRSPPVAITVKALPAAKQPANYSGAVGQFALNVLAPPPPVHAGELVKIRLVITGSGNFSLLTPPVVQWPKGVDTADPSVKELVNRYAYPLSGAKTFEYSFAAPDTGQVTIPAVELSYYDPSLNAYKISASSPVALRILPGLPEDTARKREAALAESGNPGIPRHFYWFALVVLLIVGWIIFQSVQLRRNKKTVPVTPAEPVKSPAELFPAPAEMLRVARAALQQGDQKIFLHELQQTLWKLAAVKCAVPPSSLNKQNIADRLMGKGVPVSVTQAFTAVLQECEWASYVPAGEMGDGTLLLQRAEQVIQELQQV